MKQPLFTINSTFSEEEVVRFNKYVILHMFHYVRNVVICNIILLLFTVGMIVNDITSEDFPIGSIMMFLVIIIVNWSHYCPVKILDLEINRVDHHPLGR